MGFWLLGMSSRCGDMTSKLCYGQLLKAITWQQVTHGAAVLGVAAAAFGYYFHSDTPSQRDVAGVQMTKEELQAILKRVFGSGRFWLAAAATSCATVVKRTLESLVSVYFADSAPDLVSSGQAAQLSTVWSAGLAVLVIVGGWLFDRLATRGRKYQIMLVLILMLLTIVGCGVMAMLSSFEAQSWGAVWLRAAVLFVAALGVGLPYYVPTGMFSIAFGRENSGVVSAYLDTVAFALSGIFMAALQPILDSSDAGWATVWWLLALVSVLMLVLYFFFLRMLLFSMLGEEGDRTPHVELEEVGESEIELATPSESSKLADRAVA